MMRILIAAMMAATLAAPAVATERGYEQFSVKVQTADLDLASAAGQRDLERRLAAAVTRLCGTPVFQTREELAALDACRTEALTNAAPQVDALRALRAVAVAANR